MSATSIGEPRLNWRRASLATSATLSPGAQNAYAICSEVSTLPNDGMVTGRDPQILPAANWPHNIFTAPGGSVFVRDNSANEANDPAQPLTRAYGV